MKSMILRAIVVSMVAIAMLGVVPTAASAKPKPVFGTFHFQDAAAGSSSISKPASGVCFRVPSHALSSKNHTDAPAFIFKDPHCSVGKELVGPGNFSPSNFGSFMVQK